MYTGVAGDQPVVLMQPMDGEVAADLTIELPWSDTLDLSTASSSNSQIIRFDSPHKPLQGVHGICALYDQPPGTEPTLLALCALPTESIKYSGDAGGINIRLAPAHVEIRCNDGHLAILDASGGTGTVVKAARFKLWVER